MGEKELLLAIFVTKWSFSAETGFHSIELLGPHENA